MISDHLLGQHLVEFRNEERRARWEISAREREDEEERWERDFDARREELEDRRADLYRYQEGESGA